MPDTQKTTKVVLSDELAERCRTELGCLHRYTKLQNLQVPSSSTPLYEVYEPWGNFATKQLNQQEKALVSRVMAGLYYGRFYTVGEVRRTSVLNLQVGTRLGDGMAKFAAQAFRLGPSGSVEDESTLRRILTEEPLLPAITLQLMEKCNKILRVRGDDTRLTDFVVYNFGGKVTNADLDWIGMYTALESIEKISVTRIFNMLYEGGVTDLGHLRELGTDVLTWCNGISEKSAAFAKLAARKA